MLRTSELQVKDVINMADGKRMGWMRDVEVDLERGRVMAIIVPRPGTGFMGLFGRQPDYVIPWEKIYKIGADVILVDMDDYASYGPLDHPR